MVSKPVGTDQSVCRTLERLRKVQVVHRERRAGWGWERERSARARADQNLGGAGLAQPPNATMLGLKATMVRLISGVPHALLSPPSRSARDRQLGRAHRRVRERSQDEDWPRHGPDRYADGLSSHFAR